MTGAYPLSRRPLQLRGTVVPNRIVRAGQGTKLAQGEVNERLTAFHLARAKGGVGLTILQDASVHPSGDAMFRLYDGSAIEGHARLVEQCRAAGMEMIQQLSHPGLMTSKGPVSASPVISPITKQPVHALTVDEVEDIIAGYVQSALNCVKAGFGGVEVLAGHGYLLGQFLSPLTNLREDDYGGTFENRARFLCEILHELRRELPSWLPVGVRLSTTELVEGGYDVTDTVALVEMLEERELVDFLDLSFGSVAGEDMMGPTSTSHGYQLESAAQVKAATSLPTIAGGRVTSMVEAETILAEGIADLVSMVRATLADPDLPVKSWAGREYDVRPCDGCNFCLESMTALKNLRCSVNPVVGVEHQEVPERGPVRDVLIIGAGPAGLECARVAAGRGHRVEVVEREPQIGGASRLGAEAPLRSDVRAFTAWQERQLDQLGVTVRTRVSVDADFLTARDPDVVVVATGARPELGAAVESLDGPIPGHDRSHVHDVLDVMRGARPDRAGEPVVVVDAIGTYAGLAPVETLAAEGYDVTLVTPLVTPLAGLKATFQHGPALHRLAALGVQVRASSVVAEIGATHVRIRSVNGEDETTVPAGFVVLNLAFTPDTSIQEQLADASLRARVEVIGDAAAPGNQAAAVAQGYAAALSV